MKNIIGHVMKTIGDFLWRIGGRKESRSFVGQVEIYTSYGKLNLIGNLGRKMYRTGIILMDSLSDEVFEDT